MLIRWQVCVQRWAGARERVCLLGGKRGCSARRTRVSGCAPPRPAPAPTPTPPFPNTACLSGGSPFGLLFRMRENSAERVHLSGCAYHSPLPPTTPPPHSAERADLSGCAYQSPPPPHPAKSVCTDEPDDRSLVCADDPECMAQ